jgi:hypothetical protein
VLADHFALRLWTGVSSPRTLAIHRTPGRCGKVTAGRPGKQRLGGPPTDARDEMGSDPVRISYAGHRALAQAILTVCRGGSISFRDEMSSL